MKEGIICYSYIEIGYYVLIIWNHLGICALSCRILPNFENRALRKNNMRVLSKDANTVGWGPPHYSMEWDIPNLDNGDGGYPIPTFKMMPYTNTRYHSIT